MEVYDPMTKKQKTLHKTVKIPVMGNQVKKYKLDVMTRITGRDSSITNKIRCYHTNQTTKIKKISFRYDTLFG